MMKIKSIIRMIRIRAIVHRPVVPVRVIQVEAVAAVVVEAVNKYTYIHSKRSGRKVSSFSSFSKRKTLKTYHQNSRLLVEACPIPL
ncbi:hypothetical protein [Domibacillus epiphyticus]|uniref:hypothetical protein n=1 Tax=Domibacillus epiphyticus TaxID=1714355 RepID=UPI0011861FF3|nr:hypothetical protein [Domibacillus epiphyticus]